ncbi:MAG: transposase [Chloroflexi bacterium]|nr:transposase [Chloroflexota bacterium]
MNVQPCRSTGRRRSSCAPGRCWRPPPPLRGRGTSKQAVCGILSRGGQVGAEVIHNVEAKTLQPLLRHRMHPGSVVCSDTFAGYTGIAAGGYIHRRAGRPAHLQGRGRAR